MTRTEWDRLIDEACLGEEDSRIARLYLIDKMPQIDIAGEMYLGHSTVQRRIIGIIDRARVVNKRIGS